MEAFIESYSFYIVIICLLVLILGCGGFEQVQKAFSKIIVFFAFLILVFNNKVAVADQTDNTRTVATSNTESISTEIDPWSGQNVDVVNEQIAKEYIVLKGDNLYSIAEQFANENISVNHLWLQMISTNSENLISKNPNLIFPGEVIIIPDFDS